MLKRIFFEGPVLILTNKLYGLVPTMAFFAIAYALFRRLRPFAFLAVWFLCLCFIFNFGSSSLSSYRPLVLAHRYLYPIQLPAILLTAGLISFLLGSKTSRKTDTGYERLFWAGLISVILIYSSAMTNWKINLKPQPPFKNTKIVAQILSPQAKIYTDKHSAKMLEFYWNFPPQNRIHKFKAMKVDDVAEDSYVLIIPQRIECLKKDGDYTAPTFYEDTPDNWQIIWSLGKAVLYRVPSTR